MFLIELLIWKDCFFTKDWEAMIMRNIVIDWGFKFFISMDMQPISFFTQYSQHPKAIGKIHLLQIFKKIVSISQLLWLHDISQNGVDNSIEDGKFPKK
jgi:hypothetical protein